MKNFISKIIGGFSVKQSESESNIANGWVNMGTTEGVRINKQNLMESNKNWVAVAINKISDNVSQAGMKLLKYDNKGTDEEIYDHPAIVLLSKPNPYLTGQQFIKVTWTHIELTGNAYWLITRIGGKITSLFPLPPNKITPVWNAERTAVLEYKYQVGASTIKYAATDIFHLKTPDPMNPLMGRGTVEGIAEWIDVDNYITEFNRRFFINGATFGSAIETETNSPTTLETLRAQLRDLYTGVKNSFKTYVLPKGSKFVESKMTMKDMDMSEGDNRYRDKILSGFGVPKNVIGITEAGSSRADAEAKNYAFQEFTIKPKLTAFYAYLTEFFLPIVDPKKANVMYFSYNDPTPDSKELKLKEDQVGLNNQAFLTVNEVRATRGLVPVEGGDVILTAPMNIPLGSTPVDPNALDEAQPVNNNVRTPSVKLLPKQNKRVIHKNIDNIFEDIAEKAATFVVSKAEEATTSTATGDRRKDFEEEHKAFIARATGTEDKMKLAVIHHDKHQADTVVKNLKKIVSKDAKGVNIVDIIDEDGAIKAVIDFATPLLGDLWKDQGQASIAKLGANVPTFAFNAVSEKLLAKSISRMAKKYTATTLSLLATQLNEGIGAGEGIDKLTARVRGVYGLTEEYRAARVARTETFSVANDAVRDAFKQSGVVKSMEWYTAEDELVCEFCGPMDGKIVGIDEGYFSKGDIIEGADGGTLALDYENIDNPPLHVNCRCEIRAGEISVKAAETVVPEVDPEIKALEQMVETLKQYEQ